MNSELLPGSRTQKIQIWIRNKSFQIQNTANMCRQGKYINRTASYTGTALQMNSHFLGVQAVGPAAPHTGQVGRGHVRPTSSSRQSPPALQPFY